ncbi:hypothetical protein ACHAWO_010256 [Cyclotella atomus]|uniref:HMG box domain-containing protein n=1 Tax=Cyclotella atomus TaxID=382360 RepID=A0ABD3NXW8_9STRA
MSMKRKGDEIPKPYSAYTIFWRLERMFILQEAGCIGDEIKACYDPNHHDPLEHPRPEKYTNLILPPYWYSSAHRKEDEKKRKHRKQDGSIDKNDLTAMISKSWREVDADVRNYVSKLAMAEKKKYAALRKSTTQTEPNTSIAPPVIGPRSRVSSGRHSEARHISMDSTVSFNIPSHVGNSAGEEVDLSLSDVDLSLFDSNSLEHDDFQFNF